MKRILAKTALSATLMAGAMALPLASAHAITDTMIEFYSDPGEFYLDQPMDRELVSYSKLRDIEICLNPSDHTVPLEVNWDDDKSAVVMPGNCFYFDAKEVVVSPAKDLESGWVLRGTIRTRND